MFAKKGCLKSTGNGVCVCVCLCLQIVRQKILFSVFYNTTPALQQDHHKPFFFTQSQMFRKVETVSFMGDGNKSL